MGLGEADTRAKLIDPALHTRGWTEDLIRREETAGAIEVVDGRPRRRARGRIDYVLRVRVNAESQPVAVALIEAKAEHLPPTHGLEQAKAYAACKRLNVPLVYASNGHLFVECDRGSGLTTNPQPLSEFPTPGDLRARYEKTMGFGLESPLARPLLMRYPGGEGMRRYYQDAAIRAVLEKLARGEKRALLSLATGAGKTYIAVQLLRKIAAAGQLRRALFVCDRDELRSQALTAFQVANYPENYFSHIVIDECHRSAWGKWSQVLTRNPDAVQVGLTATPRQLEVSERSREAEADREVNADNLRHFGEPVYEYDMGQGIEDGYLAACEIVRRDIFLDDKPRNERETGVEHADLRDKALRDADTSEVVGWTEARARYEATAFEDRLLLPERVAAMTKDLFEYLLATGGPEQKTIVFCARDRHADEVAVALNNLYAAWCATEGRPRLEPYAFKCTAASGGQEYLADLRGASRHHFIATTVDLLTTGVDVPCVRNVVFFKYVRSPIAFHQMVGRGTRLDATTGKLMFRVYDYTDATRLFGQGFVTRPPTVRVPRPGETPPPPPDRTLQVEGFDVRVTDAGQYIVTSVDGQARLVTVEEYRARLARRLVEEAPTLEQFRARWIVPMERREMLGQLPDAGRSALLVRALAEMTDFDLYDVLAELGYGLAPRTRPDRAEAFGYKHEGWLAGLPPAMAATLQALTAQFARAGTDGLESKPAEILRETKSRLFAA